MQFLKVRKGSWSFLNLPEGSWRFLFVPFWIFLNLSSWAAHKNFAVLVPLHVRSKKDRHWSGSMTHVTGCHLSPDPGHNNAGSLSKDKDRITGSLHICGHETVSEKEGKIRNQSRDTLRLQLSLHPTDVVRPSSPVSHCLGSGCFLCSYKSQHIQNHFPLIHLMLGIKRFLQKNMYQYKSGLHLSENILFYCRYRTS